MRELQTCDFCGADPVGVYEPLPASLAADQPRVALCGDCRDTLRRVLEPLDAADVGSADAGASDASSAEPTTAGRDDATATADPTVESSDAVTIDQPAAEDGDAAGEPASADRPPGYGNVLRLVRNRDESLARDALESLASSAYDMTASEVRQAVDAAIENGDLRETDAGIRVA